MYSESYSIVSQFIWKFLEGVSWNIWPQPCLFSYGIGMISTTNSLKKTMVKLEPLNDINIWEKWFSSGICHAIHICVKANDKYMTDYDKQ